MAPAAKMLGDDGTPNRLSESIDPQVWEMTDKRQRLLHWSSFRIADTEACRANVPTGIPTQQSFCAAGVSNKRSRSLGHVCRRVLWHRMLMSWNSHFMR